MFVRQLVVMAKSEWKKVGEIGVDAGLCWIGDPCYLIADEDHHPLSEKDIGPTWHAFCERMGDAKTRQFNYDAGHAGLGVCVQTGHGDGTYPVEAKIVDGVVREIRVRFVT